MARIGRGFGFERDAGRALRRVDEGARAPARWDDSHLAAGWAARAPDPPHAVRIIDLAGLDPAEGFMIQGDAANDSAGYSVSGAGDVNDDGFADVIVGATGGDDGGNGAGEAYVVFGKASGFGTIDLTSLAPADGFVIQGDLDFSFNRTGHSVSAAGDINGDGFDDVIVGSPESHDGGFPRSGEAYVIYGKASGFGSPDGAGRQVIDLSFLLAADGVTILGEDSYDQAGSSVSSAGDVNGDGFDDIIIGAHNSEDGAGYASGAAYVLFGNVNGFGAVFDLALFTADDNVGFTIDGDLQDRAGWSVASAGDVNGDGFDDVIVGAPGYGVAGQGASYVIFGKASGFADLDLASLAIADGFAIHGEAGFDQAGASVSGAGDINGDGFDDLVIASPEVTNNANNGRTAFVVYGKAGGFATVDLAALTPADGFAIRWRIGQVTSGQITNVSSAGDVDGDGIDDIIVGVPNYEEAWVIYGKAGGFDEIELKLETLKPADGFVIRGNGAQHDAGFSVSGAGDVNQDGYDDLIVGAPGGDLGGGNAGEAYVIFGGPSGVTVTGDAGADSLDGGEGKDSLRGKGGDDTLDGGAGSDTLDGAGGSDWADYSDAAAKVRADLQAPHLNSAEAAGDVYISIENLRGGNGNDALRGDTGANILDGGDKNDNLSGRKGDDTLIGGDGKDTLKGGKGADQLLLASLDPGHADKIAAFDAADVIALDSDVYGIPEGALAAGSFVVGSAAQDADDRLVYNDATGRLFFDPDGTGAQAQLLIASFFAPAPTLSAGDFVVI